MTDNRRPQKIKRPSVVFAVLSLLASAGTVLSAAPAQAQTLTVVDQFGTTGDDIGYGVAADRLGGVYVAGSTSGAFSGFTNAGGSDQFVRAYSRSGKLRWTRQFGTTGDEGVLGVAADQSGNVYAAGNTTGAFSGFTNAGASDVYVRAYSRSGKLRWTRQFGTSAYDWADGVAVDGSGNVYVGGATAGALEGASAGGYDGFVRSYTADGTERWTRQFGTTSDDYVNGVAVDGSGNVYAGGDTTSAFSGFTNAGDRDGFVRSYTADGTERWTGQFGTSAYDVVGGVAVDGSGNVYAAGPTTGAFSGFTNAGGSDAFVRSYTADGTYRWTSQFGTTDGDSVNGVAVDGSGNVYAHGTTGGAFSGFTNAGSADAFVRSYTADGTYRWTSQFGTTGDEYATGVVVNGSGTVYAAGYTNGAFSGFTSAGGYDGFLAKIV